MWGVSIGLVSWSTEEQAEGHRLVIPFVYSSVVKGQWLWQELGFLGQSEELHVSHLNVRTTWWYRCSYSHFTDEGVEAQKSHTTCPRPAPSCISEGTISTAGSWVCQNQSFAGESQAVTLEGIKEDSSQAFHPSVQNRVSLCLCSALHKAKGPSVPGWPGEVSRWQVWSSFPPCVLDWLIN